jgi:hypothetical protein
MRQPNRSIPGVPRPVEVLWPNIYNRAALDVTSSLPLSTSLTNLKPMVVNLPQLRQAMTEDGGLEALIDMISTTCRAKDPEQVQIRKLALQCLTQFGIRGPEPIRIRMVEAQILPVFASMLECFWRAMESDIRLAIEIGLHPAGNPRTAADVTRPPQMMTRRRAVTIGSPNAPDGFPGLQIRFNTAQSPLARLSAISVEPPVDTIPSQRRHVNDSEVIVTESDGDRMDVDSQQAHDADEEVVSEDPLENEGLRSPRPEEDGPYSSSFPSTAENQDPSSTFSPNVSPRTQPVSVMEIEVSHETSAIPQAEASASESITTTTIPLPPSSPIPAPPMLRQVNVQGVPPNAPLLPRAFPGQVNPPMHPISKCSEVSRISSLHSAHGSRDPRVPRSEDIHDCLETLGYLTKYPKLRAHFLSTRFSPSLLYSWATPEDRVKDVNIFEIVERFTFTKYHPENITEWAGVVMRHYGRKDDVVMKRQCGNLQCRKWETDEPGMKFICCPKCKSFPPHQRDLIIDVLGIVQNLVLGMHGLAIRIGAMNLSGNAIENGRCIWSSNSANIMS